LKLLCADVWPIDLSLAYYCRVIVEEMEDFHLLKLNTWIFKVVPSREDVGLFRVTEYFAFNI
jgi:hypothetical protein